MSDWVTFQGFTRVKWGVIISSFGKSRRFSEVERFLHEIEAISKHGNGINPQAVRRTLRFLVLYSYRRDIIEMTLTWALQRGSSMQFS
ncbi:hypothetical protein V6N13_086896 [Hibiscus sabdariffa]|uniref:Uncharacterized protein n=1 Tax=Hibiscus sabdariffa TaxID=183260 RepID=A0ABR2FVF0_9ROSI